MGLREDSWGAARAVADADRRASPTRTGKERRRLMGGLRFRRAIRGAAATQRGGVAGGTSPPITTALGRADLSRRRPGPAAGRGGAVRDRVGRVQVRPVV